MNNTNVENIGKKFLEDIDNYIAKNWWNIKCRDIYNIYFQFFKDLKEFKGNSYGFTGLSEYLIFRFLYHQLGIRKVQLQDRWEFKSNNNLQITQSKRVLIDGEKKCDLDIAISKSGRLIGVIQIKICLTNGINEINEELKKLEKLKRQYPELKAMLIIFDLSKKGKIFSNLKNIKKERQWFNFLILQENDELFSETLQSFFGLEKVKETLYHSG